MKITDFKKSSKKLNMLEKPKLVMGEKTQLLYSWQISRKGHKTDIDKYKEKPTKLLMNCPWALVSWSDRLKSQEAPIFRSIPLCEVFKCSRQRFGTGQGAERDLTKGLGFLPNGWQWASKHQRPSRIADRCVPWHRKPGLITKAERTPEQHCEQRETPHG